MIRFDTLLETQADWMRQGTSHGDIVVTSRIRLARNLVDHAFPGWGRKQENEATLRVIQSTVESLPQLENAFSRHLNKLTAIQKQALVERHMISREHAARAAGSAAVMNQAQSISIMINEEDHLRMQSIQPGLALRESYRILNEIDTDLEQSLEFAFDKQLGFLTACPTNLGTGLRASAMLHLPALMLSDQVNQVIQAVNKIGLAVRGLYGEGTEALGNLFQVSNQTTLGDRELEIIARLQKVIEQIVNHEKNARQKLLSDNTTTLCDQVGRAFALLRHAHVLPSKEALNLISMLRLGVDLKFFPSEFVVALESLLMEIQPAHLQIRADRKLPTQERDEMRSQIIRDRLKTLPKPNISNALQSLDQGSTHPTEE
ncbi:MAG: protein arginine kinase [Verrucomicrobiales bacterium]|nr:protein arginine kinase [Verrucomicrobiales bacterium]